MLNWLRADVSFIFFRCLMLPASWRWNVLTGLLVLLLAAGLGFSVLSVAAEDRVQAASGECSLSTAQTASYVRLVLFWSPDCRFCRQVVEKDLPPILQPFGSLVQILYIDLNEGNAQDLYEAALQRYEVTSGIPMLVIGEKVLQGSQITQQLPGLIEKYLSAGGVDWPEIPGLDTWLAALSPPMAQSLGTAECSECALTATRLAGMQAAKTAHHQAIGTITPTMAVVRAVMFWMNGCPHCHEVLDHVLPPLQEQYGDQLQVLLIELVGGAEVDALYALADHLGISKERVGVPFLVIGKHVLIGSGEIPVKLPGLIEQYLAAGGVDLPSDPVLEPFLPQAIAFSEFCTPDKLCGQGSQEATDVVPSETVLAATSSPAQARSAGAPRPNGFGLAMAVLILLFVSVVYALIVFTQRSTSALKSVPVLRRWMQFGLILAGLGIAGYLAYVETQLVEAVCGPVGDCNVVQQSPYAHLFGVLPVGVLGILGYLGMLGAWLAQSDQNVHRQYAMSLAMFFMALASVLFSIYLTYLELFVIQAVCLWCLSSAVIMAFLLILSVSPASAAWWARKQMNL